MTKSPNPVDKHVGARLRMRRVLMAMSQEKLGEALGITFQQVQKYEKGTNRIGASRLQQAARILGVPVNFFFEGAQPDVELVGGFAENPPSAYVSEFAASADGRKLVAAFMRIKEPKLRKRIVDLVEAMAADSEA
jgi:transcriptional regulator with XRE-family HTH domain